MKSIYIATPIGTLNSKQRQNAEQAYDILTQKGFHVYAPWKYKVPNAWAYTNKTWGEIVFCSDTLAIDKSDIVVVLSYGRKSTAGTNWEAGYAFGTNKTVIVVEMTNKIMSCMVSNGNHAVVKGLNGLALYDFNTMIRMRTATEQK